MTTNLIEELRALHVRGEVVNANAGYPHGWCTHDQRAWPCPTMRIVNAATPAITPARPDSLEQDQANARASLAHAIEERDA